MTIINALSREKMGEEAAREFKEARTMGKVRLGKAHLFFRTGLKVFAVPFDRITRCFRRVLLVPMKVCCGRGELQVEHLVIHTEEGEVAQIQLPDTRVAKKLMEELKKIIPGAEFVCPPKV